MAITLNKLAVSCEQMAIESGHITENSSAQPLLYDISRNWRLLREATSFRSDRCDGWSEKEVAAGEVVVSAITYLQRIGCRNIEQLLKDTIGKHATQNGKER